MNVRRRGNVGADYRLRNLLVLLAILPPLVSFGWTKYQAWREAMARRRWRSKLTGS